MVIGLARFINAFVEAMNARIKLPRYIILIFDKDVIVHTNRLTKYGQGDMIEDVITDYDSIIDYLLRNFENAIKEES